MAKKYYQDKKDRRDESKGMKKYMKDSRKSGGYGEYGAFVVGHDPDIGRDSHAGMPDMKVMAKYPKSKSMKGGYINDTMTDIDSVQNQAERTSYSNMSHQK